MFLFWRDFVSSLLENLTTNYRIQQQKFAGNTIKLKTNEMSDILQNQKKNKIFKEDNLNQFKNFTSKIKKVQILYYPETSKYFKMMKKQKEGVNVANLIVFCNEKDSQQQLVFDLKYGENIIGLNTSKCSVVFRFTNEIDEFNTKICIEDDDFTLEDLGSKKGTFKINSDNNYIRLKPFKSYDLQNNQTFLIGKFKCIFQITKSGRGNALPLNSGDLQNSLKNISNYGKKGLKKTQSIEEDIEDYAGQQIKASNIKGYQSTIPNSKVFRNKIEPSSIDEDEEQEKQKILKNCKLPIQTNGILLKKTENSQKSFVKSKGQLKNISGVFENPIILEQDLVIKKNERVETPNKKKSNKYDEDEFDLSLPKPLSKLSNQEDKNSSNKKRQTRKNTLETEQESVEPKNEDQLQLDQQFLKRIQEKLKNNQKNQSKRQSIELTNKLSLQKRNSEKQSQDIPFDDKHQIQNIGSIRNGNYLQSNKSRKSSKIDSSLDSQISDKALKYDKGLKKIKVDNEETKSIKKSNVQNELKKDTDIKKKDSKKEEQSIRKKTKKNNEKKEEKNKKIMEQIEIESNDEQLKRSHNQKSDKNIKNDKNIKQKSKDYDSLSSSQVDRSDNDEDYSVEEEEKDNNFQIQKVVKVTRKRIADEAIKNKLNEQNFQTVQKNPKQIKQDIPSKKQKKQEEVMSKVDKKEQKYLKIINSDLQNKDKLSTSKSKEQNSIPAIKITRSTRKIESDKYQEEKNKKQTINESIKITSSTKKNAQKQTSKETKDKDEKMEIEEIKTTKKSLRIQSAKEDELNIDKLKKSEKKIKQKGNLDDKQTQKDNKPIKHIKRTGGSKKELKQLQQSVGSFLEIPNRIKYRILFSNSTTTDQEKKVMENLSVKILNEFNNPNDFNILVTDDFKRRLKTLVALNKGYPIISSSWIEQCIKNDKIIPYDTYILKKVDSSLAKQYSFDLKQTIENQKNNPQGILSKISFTCHNQFDNLSIEDVRKLVESAGGTFQNDKSKSESKYYLSDTTKQDYNQQLNEKKCVVLDIEGLLQTCLLQFNVLDNYIIVAKDKKSTSKNKRKV